MNIRKRLTFIFALFGVIFFAGAAFASAPAPINVNDLVSGNRALVIGYIADMPPFYFSDSASPKGLDAAVANEVAKRAGLINVQYKKFKNYTALNNALKNGKIDVIISDYWDIPAHRAMFALSVPYYTLDGIAFIFAADKYSFKNAGDLAGHPVGTSSDQTDVVTWMKQHPVPQGHQRVYPTREALMGALKNNKIDAAFVYYTDYLFRADQQKYPYKAVLVEPVNSVFAVRKKDIDLLKTLNNTLESMWSDKTLYTIAKQYVGPLGVEPATDYQRANT